MLRVALASTALLFLTACGGSDGGDGGSGDDEIDASQPGMSKHAKTIDATDAIVEAGFAQDDTYVNTVAIVDNPLDDPEYGHEIDVTFELLDKDGKVIAKDTAYGAFAWVGQRSALTAQLETTERVAKVTATAKLRVASDPAASPVEPARGRVGADGFGELTIHNPRDEPLKGFEVVVVCRDARKAITGVGSEDVLDAVPAGADKKVEISVVGVGPADCVGYPGLV